MTIQLPGTLTDETAEALRGLANRSWADDFYLAGSAALALYRGHRVVRGLDLMSSTNRLASADRRDLLGDLLEMDETSRVETARDGYLFARLGSGVGLRLFYYPYPSIEPHESADGLAVASEIDLALMKLGAIISRGTRRDFVDLYLLCRNVQIAEVLDRSEDKFGHVRDFQLQALKGLADLSLVERDPMPQLVDGPSWAEVESWLFGEVRSLARERVGLGG